MSKRRTQILNIARRYPVRILLSLTLGFSGALFNGINTALLVPLLLQLAGQEIETKGFPPLIKTLVTPVANVPDNYKLLSICGIVLFTLILKNSVAYANNLNSVAFSRTMLNDVRGEALEVLLSSDLDYFTKRKAPDLSGRLMGDISRALGAVNAYLSLVTVSITILVFAGLLVSISLPLTLVSIGLSLAVVSTNRYFNQRQKKFGKQISTLARALGASILEVLSGIRLVKLTGSEEREFHKIKDIMVRQESAAFKSKANSALIRPLNEVLNMVTLLLLLLVGRTFFADQLDSLSTILLTYLLILFRLLPFITNISSTRNSLASSEASVDVMLDLLSRRNKPIMGSGSHSYSVLKDGIFLENVSFTYPNHDQKVLDNITLSIPKGTTLALVGTSGAGKSTLADVLARLYDPDVGRITLDGIDLRDYDLKELRQNLGFVSQDTFLFNDTIFSNILYGRIDATREDVIAAAKRANAYEFIMDLPDQFETLIGDRGVLLSGGQRQRLSIARTLLQDPDILILDEATSALDTVSERLVQEALEELSRERTSVVIAHRLSTIKNADQIAVMKDGQVIEVGNHSELLQKAGAYSYLWEIQFGKAKSTSQDADALNHDLLRHASYNFRTRLTSILGYLSLMADADGVRDGQYELANDAYLSALSLFESLEHLEAHSKSIRP